MSPPTWTERRDHETAIPCGKLKPDAVVNEGCDEKREDAVILFSEPKISPFSVYVVPDKLTVDVLEGHSSSDWTFSASSWVKVRTVCGEVGWLPGATVEIAEMVVVS